MPRNYDDLETDYWGELLPDETWDQFDVRQRCSCSNEFIDVMDLVYSYLEDEDYLN